jgi:hypothetical protein
MATNRRIRAVRRKIAKGVGYRAYAGYRSGPIVRRWMAPSVGPGLWAAFVDGWLEAWLDSAESAFGALYSAAPASP